MESTNSTEDFPTVSFPFGPVGSIACPVLITVYMLVILSVVCDEYFVPCIQAFCKKLSLSQDVAAATLMAAGINAPELFTNLISTFKSAGDVGTGAVVGSGVFNVLAIPSLCILLSRTKSIQLEDIPLTRDTIFYIAAVTVLAFVIQDGQVHWYESLVMLALYTLYIVVMKYNAKIVELSENYRRQRFCAFISDDAQAMSPLLIRKDLILETGSIPSYKFHPEIPVEQSCGCSDILQQILTFPAQVLLKLTIPSCQTQGSVLLIVTFTMCAIWMAGLTYVITWMITILGLELSVPHSVMGVTFIAAGLSIPETVSSVIVAKQGLGAMALGSTLGSSIFGILVCMGVPWFLNATLIRPDHSTQISSTGLDHSLYALVISIIIMYLLFCFNDYKLDIKIGLVCLVMYATFISLFIYTEITF